MENIWGENDDDEGIVSTLAGSATSGWVDGVGTAARFIGIQSIIVSSSGVIYVGDSYAIRVVTSSGKQQSLMQSLSLIDIFVP